MLENRIRTECAGFKLIFWLFEKEPTIRSVSDKLSKEPGRLYYMLYNLPFPDYLADEKLGVNLGGYWESPTE